MYIFLPRLPLCGCDAFLIKPFLLSSLASLITLGNNERHWPASHGVIPVAVSASFLSTFPPFPFLAFAAERNASELLS